VRLEHSITIEERGRITGDVRIAAYEAKRKHKFDTRHLGSARYGTCSQTASLLLSLLYRVAFRAAARKTLGRRQGTAKCRILGARSVINYACSIHTLHLTIHHASINPILAATSQSEPSLSDWE
jgi:hypothetical protein